MINIQENVVIAPYTTFKIGGPARFLVDVSSSEELSEAIGYAEKNSLEVFILGGGSNVLVSENGFGGLMIRMVNNSCSLSVNLIECGGGAQLSEVVSLATNNSLTGLEWAAGIPGSVGGAIRGNAGAFGGEMADAIKEILTFDGNILKSEIYDRKKCLFSYRSSIFKKNKNLIVLSAVLELQKGEKNKIEAKIRENIKKRLEKQPQGASAGSFFENPVVTDKKLIANFEKDTSLLARDNKIPAGWLIAEAGLLGKKIGGAKVSEDHGNFVINTGDAAAEDVVILASFIKQRVRGKFGVQLKEEIQYVGF